MLTLGEVLSERAELALGGELPTSGVGKKPSDRVDALWLPLSSSSLVDKWRGAWLMAMVRAGRNWRLLPRCVMVIVSILLSWGSRWGGTERCLASRWLCDDEVVTTKTGGWATVVDVPIEGVLAWYSLLLVLSSSTTSSSHRLVMVKVGRLTRRFSSSRIVSLVTGLRGGRQTGWTALSMDRCRSALTTPSVVWRREMFTDNWLLLLVVRLTRLRSFSPILGCRD